MEETRIFHASLPIRENHLNGGKVSFQRRHLDLTFGSTIPDSPPKRERRSTEECVTLSEEAQKRQRFLQQIENYRVQEIDSRLIRIVTDLLGVEEREVVPSASLVEDMNADSLDLVEYFMSLKEVFNIKIPDEDMDIILTTVGETQAYLAVREVL